MVKRKRKPDHAEKYIKTVRAVGEIEKHHEDRYRALLKNLETAQVFEKSEVKVWECRNCGHIVIGTKALESVRYAIIHRVTLKSMQRTINVDR